MKIERKALEFATYAHDGAVRKAEIQKPYIIHPIHVAGILRSYGFDSNVVAAGFLHDVVEDTEFLEEDIFNVFGEDITSLVLSASQTDKSMSWFSRKQLSIDMIRDEDLRHKAVVCADKISNLDDLRILFGKLGQYDFSSFREGLEGQMWYYVHMYESLIHGGYEHHPLFEKLKELIDFVFLSDDLFLYAPCFYQEQEFLKLQEIFQLLRRYELIVGFPMFGFSVEEKRDKSLLKLQKTLKKIKEKSEIE